MASCSVWMVIDIVVAAGPGMGEFILNYRREGHHANIVFY